jgi:hypothetical protein
MKKAHRIAIARGGKLIRRRRESMGEGMAANEMPASGVDWLVYSWYIVSPHER